MSKAKMLRYLAVLIPIVSMLSFYLANLRITKTGKPVFLKVEGYDPRDLLSGYYIRYNVDYGKNFCTENSKKAKCLCLAEGTGGFHQGTKLLDCEDAVQQCRLFLNGNCKTRFIAGIEKFFIPEDNREKVTRLPSGSKILVKIAKNGHAVVEDLYINDLPLTQYLKEQDN